MTQEALTNHLHILNDKITFESAHLYNFATVFAVYVSYEGIYIVHQK